MRSKIRENKKKPVTVAAPPPPEEIEPQKEDVPQPDVEVGSVGHYKELTKQK